MTLCEALNWCRASWATVRFAPDAVTVTVGLFKHYKADTLEAAVDAAACADSKPGETVAEAARRGFAGG